MPRPHLSIRRLQEVDNLIVLHYLYFGVTTGVYPSIVFLGLGAMTDFSSLLAHPKRMLLGAAFRWEYILHCWVPRSFGRAGLCPGSAPDGFEGGSDKFLEN